MSKEAFWCKESSGGAMGSHILIMRGTRYVGHFYPDATDELDVYDLFTLIEGDSHGYAEIKKEGKTEIRPNPRTET